MSTPALNQTISDLINGNLSDAKKRAKRHSSKSIRQAYQDETGCSLQTAVAAADYLKGEIGFQEYCDAKHEAGDR